MSTHPPASRDALAEVLREHPPTLDELSKARIEKNLLEALREPRRKSMVVPRPPASKPGYARYGVVTGVAAAAAIAFFALRAPGVPTAHLTVSPLAQGGMEGTLEEGSTVRTDEGEQADIRIAESRIHIEPSSVVRLETLGSDRIVLGVTRGAIRVEFHPQVRGEERMSVRTPHARVDVVGTVFTVRTDEHSTGVAVSEGRVRVVPHEGEMRSVGAGEATRVGGGRDEAAPGEVGASAPPSASETSSGSAEEEDPEAPADPPSARPRDREVVTPAQRLARARALVRRQQNDEAEAILRALLGRRTGSARIRAEAFTLLGDLMRRAQRHAEASRAYEGAASAGAGSLSHMAVFALARMQDRDEHDPTSARRSYRRYIELAPGGPLVGQARQALCRLGDASMCSGAR